VRAHGFRAGVTENLRNNATNEPDESIMKQLPSSGDEAWVYLLRCRDGSLYTGWTVDLERRLARHRAGIASRYTASRLPVELELAIQMSSRTAARREEARIKSLPRAGKLALLTAARASEQTGGPPAEPPRRGGRRDR
jgi:putative endonuclease